MNPVFLRLIFIPTLMLMLYSSAFAQVSSTINGKNVNWQLLFGKDVNVIAGIPSDRRGTKIPIILVHGNNSENQIQARWTTFINKFTNYDQFDVWTWIHDTSKAIGFNGYTGNALELQDCIKNYILPYYKQGTKPILIAHSRGGLVCRSYMNFDYGYGKPEGENTLGLITLGTPHHGSPLAVPDWAAVSFTEGSFNYKEFLFDKAYGVKANFDITRYGSINLAWDNMDQATPFITKRIRISSSYAIDGYMDYSPRDMNCPSTQYFSDLTMYYHDQWTSWLDIKSYYGTLQELNSKENYKEKIVAFAAYDNDLEDNDNILRNFAMGLLSSLEIFKLDHQLLKPVVSFLADFEIQNFTRPRIHFFANDGLVPLQSALFLDISDGLEFCQLDPQSKSVYLLNNNIAARLKIKKAYTFTNDIKDHLDLLDTEIDEYWNSIFKEIENFKNTKNTKIGPILSLLLDQENSSTLPTSGLISYYKFNNNVYDSGGAANNGTAFNGVSYISGKNDLAASFDGVDDYIRIDNKLAFNSGDFTITAWVKTSQEFAILSQWTAGTTADNFIFGITPTENNLYLEIRRQGSDTPTYLPSTLSVSPNQWVFVAATYDESDGKCVLYVNNQSQTFTTGFSDRKVDTSAEIYIGRKRYKDSEFTQGSIDELRVYNRVLSLSEILNLANL